MFRNHIAEKIFIRKLVKSVNKTHERLGEAMPKFRRDLMSNDKYGAIFHPHAPK